MDPRPRDEMRDYQGRGLLAGARALITGGDSGIGRAVAVAFAKEGADVAIAYLSQVEDEDAAHTADLVKAAGQRCVTIRGDLAVEDNCQRAVEQAVTELGGLDVLVNNVATQEPIADLADLSTAQWERTFRVNVQRPFRRRMPVGAAQGHHLALPADHAQRIVCPAAAPAHRNGRRRRDARLAARQPCRAGLRRVMAVHLGRCLAGVTWPCRARNEQTMPRAQIKDEQTYQKLRDKGESKEKAARIANAAAGSSTSKVGRKGGKSGSYDDWSKQDLVRRAKEIGIKGRSTMSKAELIKALRDH